MSEEDLKKLREGLQRFHGSKQKIVDRSKELKEGGFHRNFITMLLKGERKNKKLLQLCQEVYIELLKKDVTLDKTISENNRLIKQIA